MVLHIKLASISKLITCSVAVKRRAAAAETALLLCFLTSHSRPQNKSPAHLSFSFAKLLD